MADIARILFKQMGIRPTSIRAVSQAMYDKRYYEGQGKTPAERVNNHVAGLTRRLKSITEALGEPMPPEGGSSPTASPKTDPLGFYSPLSGYLVRLLSAMAQDASCGYSIQFGPEARRVVVEYQQERGLRTDGIVGLKTLHAVADDVARQLTD
jgi:murein L,D-transpeptidase YcbB/YkuD